MVLKKSDDIECTEEKSDLQDEWEFTNGIVVMLHPPIAVLGHGGDSDGDGAGAGGARHGGLGQGE